MSSIAYIITIALLVGALIVEKILNQRTVSELHDRLAAKDLADFKYHKEIEPVELDHNAEVLRLKRKELEERVEAEKKMTPEEKAARAAAAGF